MILLVELVIVIPFIATLSVNCSHTVDYQTLHDTDTVVHKDTIHPKGPAFIRFLAVLDNGGAVTLYPKQGAGTPFVNALPQMTSEYIPVRNDTSFKLYATFHTNTNQFLDSLTVPADSLSPFSLTTIVLFETNSTDTALFPYFANDSAKKVNAPPGMCYIRLVNGLADFPTPQPAMNLHLDNTTSPPLFTDPSGSDASVFYQSAHNYVLIASGTHTVYATNESDKTQSYNITVDFKSGKYYTARLVGRKQNNTDMFVVDEE